MQPLMKSINQIARSAERFRNEALSKHNIKNHQHAYLIQVYQTPGITQDQLASAIGVNKSNVTRQLEKLEKSHYVIRKQDPDNRRIINVFPTDKCAQIYPIIMDILNQWQTYLLKDFTHEEKALVTSLMHRLAKHSLAFEVNDHE